MRKNNKTEKQTGIFRSFYFFYFQEKIQNNYFMSLSAFEKMYKLLSIAKMLTKKVK